MSWGFLGKLGKAALNFVPGGSIANGVIDAVGSGLNAASNSMTNNRSQQANLEDEKLRLGQTAERNYFDTLLQADQQKNAAAQGAFKRLLNITYMGDPSAHVQTPGLAGKYSRQIAGPSASQVEMANTPALRDSTYNRATYQTDPLQGQMPTRTPDFSALDATGKSSVWEKLLGIGGSALGAGSAARAEAARRAAQTQK